MINKRIAYSIKAMLPENEELNNKELIFKEASDKNDNVIYYKDNFDSMNEAVLNAENKIKEYSIPLLLVTYYSIGDKQ